MCVCFHGRFARPEQANGPTGRGGRMKRRDRFATQNRPERNPAERPGRDVLARRANRDGGCDAAVRPNGRMRDGPKGRSNLRHAQPSRGGRKADAGWNLYLSGCLERAHCYRCCAAWWSGDANPNLLLLYAPCKPQTGMVDAATRLILVPPTRDHSRSPEGLQ
jgi:hypothetical protein